MKFSGLTDREVEHSRQQYGSNAIPDSQPTTFWEAFKETFGDPMIRILADYRRIDDCYVGTWICRYL